MLSILRELLRNVPGVVVIFLSILLFGFVALTNLPVDLFPNIDFPVVAVRIDYIGATPEEIENTIAKIVEGQFLTISGVRSVSTRCFKDFAFFIIQFDFGVNVDLAANDVREKLDLISIVLPQNSGRPQIFKFDVSSLPILVIGVTGIDDLTALREISQNIIAQRIYQVDGVADVFTQGGYDKKVFIDIDNIKLNSFGISPVDISRALSSENQNYLSGFVLDGYKRVSVVLNAEFKSIEDIENVIIGAKGNYPIKIKDVANVSFREDIENAPIVKINGQRGILISIDKKSGGNTAKISEKVIEKIEEIKKLYPNLNFTPIVDQGTFIVSSINNVRNNALNAALLAILIVFLFLVKIKETVLIGIAIPFSLIITFAFMYFFNVTLNVVSLTGLAIAVGLTVDNSVVVIESIYLKYRQGKNPLEAAFEGTKEVITPVFASTLTTVIVFLPIVFAQGIASQIFRDLALTASISIISSAFVAIFIVPPIYSRYWIVIEDLDKKIQNNKFLSFFSNWIEEIRDTIYQKLLTRVLDLKKTVLVFSISIVILGIISFSLVGKELLPVVDTANVTVRITLPSNTFGEITSKYSEEISKYLQTNENVESFSYVVTPPGRLTSLERSGTGENVSTFRIKLKNKNERKVTVEEFSAEIKKFLSKIPGKSSVEFQNFSGAFSGGANVELKILGQNIKELERISSEIEKIAKKTPNVQEINTSFDDPLEEYSLTIDRLKLGYYGLSSSILGNTLKTSSGTTVSFFRKDGKQYDVVVQTKEDERKFLDDILSKYIQIAGRNIPLVDLVQIEKTTPPRMIMRENNNRQVSVNVIGFGISQSKLAENILSSIKKEVYIPPEITIQSGGSFKELQETVINLILVFILSFVLVYSVMAVLFRSFKDPFIIIFTVPYGVFTAIIFFFLLNFKLNIISIIGLILLLGIVVNNGIIMVNYINQLIERGYKLREAIIEGAKRRFRPILITNLTTIIGTLPLSLGIGESAEIFQPLGQTILVGLSSGVVFTLFIIPVIFEYFNRKRFA